MPLDTSIPLQAKLPQFDNIQEIQARGMQLRNLGRQEQDAVQAQQDRTTLQEIYRRATKPDGSVDSNSLITGMAQAGLGDKIPAVQKQQLDIRKDTTAVADSEYSLKLKQLNSVRGVISSVLANPNPTHDDVIQAISEAVQRGEVPADMGAQMARSLPGKQEQLRPFLVQKALEGADHAKRIELLLPKYDEQNRGGTISQGTINPMTGIRTETGSIQKTVSPDAAAQAAAIASSQGVTYQVDASGNLVAAPTKVTPGTTVQTQPVVGPDGKPLRSNKQTLSDTQAKALLFGSRMRASNRVMDTLAKGGTDIPSVTKSIADSIPIVGRGLGAAANMVMATPQQQQLEQAQRDFVNAVLRRESGAAISPSEFSSAKQQYFPQVGDSPEIKAQKKANRELAIRGLLQEVPEGQRNAIDAPEIAPGTRPPLSAILGPAK